MKKIQVLALHYHASLILVFVIVLTTNASINDSVNQFQVGFLYIEKSSQCLYCSPTHILIDGRLKFVPPGL